MEEFFRAGIENDGGRGMNQEKYIRAVLKKLRCSGRKKKEIQKELESDISAALENGESLEEIMERMGAPASLAGEFNDNFPKEEIAAFKRRKGLVIAGIIIGILLVFFLLAFYMLPKNYPMGKSGFYTEEEVTRQTKAVISYFNEGDYDALKAMCFSEDMEQIMTEEKLGEVKKLFGDDWGEFVAYGNIYLGEVVQMGKSYAVVQINATYENTGITYTLMFDKDMKLCSFYVK